MASNTITIPRGDEKVFTFTLYMVEAGVKRLLTTPELTGAKLKFTVKKRLADADADAVFQLTSNPAVGIVIDTGTSKAVITIPKAVTEAVKPGGEPLYYDLRMIDTSGNPHTFVSDKLDVVPNVTRTIP